MSALLVFPPEYVKQLRPLARYGSSASDNLALRTSPGMVHQRELVETLVRAMPPLERAKVIPRLRDRNNVNFRGALYEVVLFGYFLQEGFTVTVNAPLGDGKDADLLVERDGLEFYVEIVTLNAPTSGDVARNREEQIIRTLGNMADMGYVAELEILDTDPPDGLVPRVVRAMVRRHILQIEANAIPVDTPLQVGNILLRLRRGGHSESFVAVTSRRLESLFLAHVHGRLDEKVERFRTLGEQTIPYVVALCGGEDLHQNFHRAVERALLGWDRADPTYLLPGPRRLSAVLSCAKYVQDEEVELDLEVVHNPTADVPLPASSLPNIRHLFPRTTALGNWEGDVVGPSESITTLQPPSKINM